MIYHFKRLQTHIMSFLENPLKHWRIVGFNPISNPKKEKSLKLALIISRLQGFKEVPGEPQNLYFVILLSKTINY